VETVNVVVAFSLPLLSTEVGLIVWFSKMVKICYNLYVAPKKNYEETQLSHSILSKIDGTSAYRAILVHKWFTSWRTWNHERDIINCNVSIFTFTTYTFDYKLQKSRKVRSFQLTGRSTSEIFTTWTSRYF
jgi:hypothetical protein